MTTQTITMLPAEPVLAQLAELSAKLDRALAAAEQGSTPLYLPHRLQAPHPRPLPGCHPHHHAGP